MMNLENITLISPGVDMGLVGVGVVGFGGALVLVVTAVSRRRSRT